MSDNPFAEPEDDRTVFRPSPGGNRAAARAAPPRAAAPAAARPAAPAVARGADLQTLVGAFSNPLIAAAAPLLALLSRLSNTAAPPDQGDMRDRTARELREFERRGREAGVPMEQMRPAHYALCASLDDVVLNTPWGAHGRWRDRTLSATFHGDAAQADGGVGDGFFDQIRLMRAEPAKHLHVLELMYLCMSLGFMGRFRQVPDGAERMERILAQTYALIGTAKAGAAAPALAGSWQGVDAPYRPRRARFPLWVAAAVAVAAVAGGFVWVLDGLNARSDLVLRAAVAAPPAAMPAMLRPPSVRPPPPPPEPIAGAAGPLRAAFAAEIGRHEMEVLETPAATIVRLPAKVLFPGGAATLAKPAEALLAKLGHATEGEATKDQPGPIRAIGYTDDRATRTVKFPSNFALSKARAEAVARAMGGGPVADGRADADPVAPNTTPEGREQNRRVDIVLPR